MAVRFSVTRVSIFSTLILLVNIHIPSFQKPESQLGSLRFMRSDRVNKQTRNLLLEYGDPRLLQTVVVEIHRLFVGHRHGQHRVAAYHLQNYRPDLVEIVSLGHTH